MTGGRAWRPGWLQGKGAERPFKFHQKLTLPRALGKHSWSLGKRWADWMGLRELPVSTDFSLSQSNMVRTSPPAVVV